jgi:hypothetical protein
VLLDGSDDGENLLRALAPPGPGLRHAAAVILIGIMQTAVVMGHLFLATRTISASTAAIVLYHSSDLRRALLGHIFLAKSLHGARLVGSLE